MTRKFPGDKKRGDKKYKFLTGYVYNQVLSFAIFCSIQAGQFKEKQI